VDRIFPRVVVGKQSDYYYEWNKGDMWRMEAAKRAPGTNFARGGIRLSSNQFKSEQIALEYKIEDEKRANADPALNLEATGVRYLVDQINLRLDYDWATAFTTGSPGWTSGTVTAKWEGSTGVPVTDVQYWSTLIKQAIGASSYRLVGVCGPIVQARLMGNAQVRNSIVYTERGTVDAVRRSIAAILGIDDLVVIDRMRNTAKENQTASYSGLMDDDFLLLAVPSAPGIDVPSAGYNFAWNEGGKGDMYVETYRDETIKSDIVRAVCYYDLVQTGATLGVFATDVCD